MVRPYKGAESRGLRTLTDEPARTGVVSQSLSPPDARTSKIWIDSDVDPDLLEFVDGAVRRLGGANGGAGDNQKQVRQGEWDVEGAPDEAPKGGDAVLAVKKESSERASRFCFSSSGELVEDIFDYCSRLSSRMIDRSASEASSTYTTGDEHAEDDLDWDLRIH